MIEGVKIKKLTTHLTEDGYFREVLRDDDDMIPRLGQSSISLTHPGIIKAFHYHALQEEVWYFFSGQVRAVLYDSRPLSPTAGETQTVIMGEDEPKILFIPFFVAHGYQVLGNKDTVLFYHTSKHYNPKDELRIPFDDPKIAFDWSIKNT